MRYSERFIISEILREGFSVSLYSERFIIYVNKTIFT